MLSGARRTGFLLTVLGIFFSLAVSAAPGMVMAEDAPAQASSPSLDFANGLYARKMYGPAISEYQKYIQFGSSAPETASAYFRLADSYYFLKEYAKAVQAFEVFQTKFPDEPRVPSALFRIGTARYFLKNYPGARHALSDIGNLEAEDNIHAGALFYLAKISEAESKPDEALSELRGLTENYPATDYTVYACLFAGDLFMVQKNEPEALRVYKLVADGTVRPPDGKSQEAAVEEAKLKVADLYFAAKKYPEALDFYQKAYAMGRPSSFERVLTGLFYSHYYLKELDACKKLLFANEDFLKHSPISFDVDYLIAVLAHEKKDYHFSLERLDHTLNDSRAADDKKARAKTARTYIQAESFRIEGKTEEALAGYLETLKSQDSPYAAPALYQAGFLSAQLKKNSDARQYLGTYAAKFPQSDEAERAALQKIQVDLDEGQWDAVVLGANDYLKTHSGSRYQDVALYKLGMGLTGQKNDSQAAITFQKLILDFEDSQLYPEALYGAAASFDSAEDTAKAIEFYEKFIEGFPSHPLYPDAMARLGFLYVRAKDYRKASKFYEDILLNKPEIPLESSTAFWVIRYDLSRGAYDRMRAVLSVLTTRYPGEILTHEINFFLGESLMGLKNYPEALQYYSKSVEANPTGTYVPYAFLGMGIVSAAQGHLDAAENFFAKALGFETGVDVAVRARFEIANLQLKRNNLEEASKAFMHVAILYDDEKYCSAALFKAGECMSKLGNAEESEKVFQELLKRYPKTNWARRAELILKKARAKNG